MDEAQRRKTREVARTVSRDAGCEQLAPPGDKMQICSFLWVYYGYPASSYEGVNTEVARNRCGMALARRDDVEVDVVAGIPDSGIGHAIGYASQALAETFEATEAAYEGMQIRF